MKCRANSDARDSLAESSPIILWDYVGSAKKDWFHIVSRLGKGQAWTVKTNAIADGIEELLEQEFTWSHGRKFGHISVAPLVVVYPDGVLAHSIAFQSLEPAVWCQIHSA